MHLRGASLQSTAAARRSRLQVARAGARRSTPSRCHSAGAVDEALTESAAAPAEPAANALELKAPEACCVALVPAPAARWSTTVEAAARDDVLQFSAAAAAGLPLLPPSGLALVLALLATTRAGRTARISAVHELSSLLDARSVAGDEEAKAAAEESLEQLRVRQQAEAKRQADEAAAEAARVAADRQAQEAEEAQVQVLSVLRLGHRPCPVAATHAFLFSLARGVACCAGSAGG